MSNSATQDKVIDDSIIRPQMLSADFKIRGQDMPPARLKNIKKGLLTLHTLELMASTIYKFQITDSKNELNRQLIAAMCNEMVHPLRKIPMFSLGFNPVIKWQ